MEAVKTFSVIRILRKLADKVNFEEKKHFFAQGRRVCFSKWGPGGPFQPHFRQNTRLFQDPEDPHSTTMKICKPLHVHMLCKLQVTNALTHLNVKQLTNRLNNVNQSLFLPSVPLHEEKYGIG